MPKSHCPLRPSASALGIAPVFSPLLRPSPAASCLPRDLYNPVYPPSKDDALSLPLSPAACLAPSALPPSQDAALSEHCPFPVWRCPPLLFSRPIRRRSRRQLDLLVTIAPLVSQAIHVSLVNVHLIACGRPWATGPVRSWRIAPCVAWPVNVDASFSLLDLFLIVVCSTISASPPSTGT
jgi:hypothetical protein